MLLGYVWEISCFRERFVIQYWYAIQSIQIQHIVCWAKTPQTKLGFSGFGVFSYAVIESERQHIKSYQLGRTWTASSWFEIQKEFWKMRVREMLLSLNRRLRRACVSVSKVKSQKPIKSCEVFFQRKLKRECCADNFNNVISTCVPIFSSSSSLLKLNYLFTSRWTSWRKSLETQLFIRWRQLLYDSVSIKNYLNIKNIIWTFSKLNQHQQWGVRESRLTLTQSS